MFLSAISFHPTGKDLSKSLHFRLFHTLCKESAPQNHNLLSVCPDIRRYIYLRWLLLSIWKTSSFEELITTFRKNYSKKSVSSFFYSPLYNTNYVPLKFLTQNRVGSYTKFTFTSQRLKKSVLKAHVLYSLDCLLVCIHDF